MARPNGFIIAIAIVFATRSVVRSIVVVAPSMIAFVAWLAYLYALTGDPLIFVSSKSAWAEVRLVDILYNPSWLTDASMFFHAVAALLAALLVIAAWRKMSVAWFVFVALWIIPLVVLGIVGSARYVAECFPVAVAAGYLVERWPSKTKTVLVAGLGASLVMVTWFQFGADWLP